MSNKKQQEEVLNIGEAVSRSEAFINKYKKTIILCLVALVTLVAAYIAYVKLYSEPREEKAQVAIAKGQQYFALEMFSEALNGDSVGYKGFLSVIDNYGGTKAGNLAKGYAGICYAKLGETEKAIKMLDGFKGDDAMVSPAIIGAKGNCYAKLGQLDKATSTLLDAAKRADNITLSPIYLMQAADIFKSQKKYDDALKAYRQVKEKYFNSIQAMEIDKYIEEVELLKK